MTAVEHKTCYGAMFPSTSRAPNDPRTWGKVFSFVLVGPCGMLPRTRQVEVNRPQWDACVQCPEFDNCYRLGMARMVLETAAATN
jgi:hypothetical protein